MDWMIIIFLAVSLLGSLVDSACLNVCEKESIGIDIERAINQMKLAQVAAAKAFEQYSGCCSAFVKQIEFTQEIIMRLPKALGRAAAELSRSQSAVPEDFGMLPVSKSAKAIPERQCRNGACGCKASDLNQGLDSLSSAIESVGVLWKSFSESIDARVCFRMKQDLLGMLESAARQANSLTTLFDQCLLLCEVQ